MDCSNSLVKVNNFWKFDKIDKLFVSLLLIFVTFCSCLDVFCYATESVENVSLGQPIYSTVVTGIFPDSTTNETGVFVKLPEVDTFTCYFSLVKGHKYIVYNLTSSDYSLRYSSSVPAVGVEFTRLGLVSANSSLSFTSENDDFLFLSSSSSSGYNVDGIVLYDVTDSMSSSVESLVNNVGITQIWSIFETGLPFVLVVVLVGFGIFIICYCARKIQKGKMGL